MDIPRGFRPGGEARQLRRGAAMQQQAANQTADTVGRAIQTGGQIAADVQQERWRRQAASADAAMAVAATEGEQRLNEIRRDREVTPEDIAEVRSQMTAAGGGRVPPGYAEAREQALDKWEADTRASWAKTNYRIEREEQAELFQGSLFALMDKGQYGAVKTLLASEAATDFLTPTQLRTVRTNVIINEEHGVVNEMLANGEMERAQEYINNIPKRENLSGEAKSHLQGSLQARYNATQRQLDALAAAEAKEELERYEWQSHTFGAEISEGMHTVEDVKARGRYDADTNPGGFKPSDYERHIKAINTRNRAAAKTTDTLSRINGAVEGGYAFTPLPGDEKIIRARHDERYGPMHEYANWPAAKKEALAQDMDHNVHAPQVDGYLESTVTANVGPEVTMGAVELAENMQMNAPEYWNAQPTHVKAFYNDISEKVRGGAMSPADALREVSRMRETPVAERQVLEEAYREEDPDNRAALQRLVDDDDAIDQEWWSDPEVTTGMYAIFDEGVRDLMTSGIARTIEGAQKTQYERMRNTFKGTRVNGEYQVMAYPPEYAGGRTTPIDTDWILEKFHEDLAEQGYGEGEYRLVSDLRTARSGDYAVLRVDGGPVGLLPRWRVPAEQWDEAQNEKARTEAKKSMDAFEERKAAAATQQAEQRKRRQQYAELRGMTLEEYEAELQAGEDEAERRRQMLRDKREAQQERYVPWNEMFTVTSLTRDMSKD